MEDKHISGFFYESTMARFERSNRRLVIVIIALIVILFLNNLSWLYVCSEYEFTIADEMITVDGGNGTAAYVGNDGDITYGENYGLQTYGNEN